MILIAASLLWMAGVDQAKAPASVRRTMIVREQVVIRVPLRPLVALPVPSPMSGWKESRGPKCIDPGLIAAATIMEPNSVDFVLRDRSRVRAKLQSSCPALDYYYRFFVKPTEDGRICADRDAIHSRMGGECEIDAFRKLTPKPAR